MPKFFCRVRATTPVCKFDKAKSPTNSFFVHAAERSLPCPHAALPSQTASHVDSTTSWDAVVKRISSADVEKVPVDDVARMKRICSKVPPCHRSGRMARS